MAVINSSEIGVVFLSPGEALQCNLPIKFCFAMKYYFQFLLAAGIRDYICHFRKYRINKDLGGQ